MACTGGATHYQYPADAMPVAGLQRSFSDGMQNTETAGVELVQRFRPGGAHAALTDIDRLIADCGGQYAVIARDLGGKESLLIRADEKAIGGEYSHGHVMYNAIARDGDYLIWIQIVQNQQRAGHGYTQAQLVQWVRSAARHADQKACTATAC
jgi:hypothetical protein